MDKKHTKAKSPLSGIDSSMASFNAIPVDHFVEAVPWDGNSFKQEEAKRRKEQGRGPHPEDDPVEDAYIDMVDATARFFAVKQWEGCDRNPKQIGNLAEYHSEWVRDQLTKDDGTDFMNDVSGVVQRDLEHFILIEQSAQHYLKFFIVKRITQEHDAPKNSFTDVNFYSQELEVLRGNGDGTLCQPNDSEVCFAIAVRMAEIWENDYKLEIAQ